MYKDISELKGKTLSRITNIDSVLTMTTTDGDVYHMEYIPDCCANCCIVDVAGDLDDLVGTPLVMAESVSSGENPDSSLVPEYQDSFTWTFVKFATNKGYVTFIWYGESNGYYSETPTLFRNGEHY